MQLKSRWKIPVFIRILYLLAFAFFSVFLINIFIGLPVWIDLIKNYPQHFFPQLLDINVNSRDIYLYSLAMFLFIPFILWVTTGRNPPNHPSVPDTQATMEPVIESDSITIVELQKSFQPRRITAVQPVNSEIRNIDIVLFPFLAVLLRFTIWSPHFLNRTPGSSFETLCTAVTIIVCGVAYILTFISLRGTRWEADLVGITVQNSWEKWKVEWKDIETIWYEPVSIVQGVTNIANKFYLATTHKMVIVDIGELATGNEKLSQYQEYQHELVHLAAKSSGKPIHVYSQDIVSREEVLVSEKKPNVILQFAIIIAAGFVFLASGIFVVTINHPPHYRVVEGTFSQIVVSSKDKRLYVQNDSTKYYFPSGIDFLSPRLPSTFPQGTIVKLWVNPTFTTIDALDVTLPNNQNLHYSDDPFRYPSWRATQLWLLSGALCLIGIFFIIVNIIILLRHNRKLARESTE